MKYRAVSNFDRFVSLVFLFFFFFGFILFRYVERWKEMEKRVARLWVLRLWKDWRRIRKSINEWISRIIIFSNKELLNLCVCDVLIIRLKWNRKKSRRWFQFIDIEKSSDSRIYSSPRKSFLSSLKKRRKNREMAKCKLKMKFQSMLQIIYVHSYCEESNLFLRPDKAVVRCFNKFITSVTIIDLPINIVKAIPIYVSRVA